MIKRFIYGRNRTLGILMITLYTAGILPVSFSTAFSNDSLQSDTVVMENELTSLNKADAWINTNGLTGPELKGKVVLVEFCTYTCINWLRTMPYVRAWSEKYKDKGLVVIGVHTPEFSFEKNIDNVRKSIHNMKIDIPVAIDNNYLIWRAFNNQYWPALYFIDAKGRMRHTKFGEGDYEESEKEIQQLLKEGGSTDVSNDFVAIEGKGIEVAADWNNLGSQENYLGSERTANFSSPGGIYNKQHSYTLPEKLSLNHWALSGNWIIDGKSIQLNKSNGKIVYRFHARDMHIVMGSSFPGASVHFRVLIDGRPPASAHGIDIDEQGYGILKDQRLYQLIRQHGPVADRNIEIEFFDSGAEVFSCTFG